MWNVPGLEHGFNQRTGLVHAGIVRHVHDEDVHLDNVLQAASGLLKHVLDVLQCLFLSRLRLEPSRSG